MNVDGENIKAAKMQYEIELSCEELFLRNKSRQTWLKSGDRNTAYFAACVKDNRIRMNNMKLQLGESDADTMERSLLISRRHLQVKGF